MSGWPKETKHLSKRTVRVDAKEKVTGRAKYTYDQHPKGMLYGMMLRSKWPAARLEEIDLQPALDMPGVEAAVLVQDVPRDIRFYGQEIAAVAAATPEIAEEAIRAIKLKATVRPHVVDPMKSIEEGAPEVFKGRTNLSTPKTRERANPDEAFAKADVVAEVTVMTQAEIHHPLETHGHVIDWGADGNVTVWASTQAISSVKNAIAKALDVPSSQVRVISEFMGGGFGAKFGSGVEGLACARLSKATKKPVKLMLSRFDNHHSVGNRPGSYQKIKIAADKSGKLVAYENIGFGSAGYASGGATAGGGGGAGFKTPYVYDVRPVKTSQFGVAIHAGSARAFRAPQHPQGCFGMETAMQELCDKLGMDPVEFRKMNTAHEVRLSQFDLAAERFEWKKKFKKPGSSKGAVKSGVGVATGEWGGGGKNSTAEVIVGEDGSVEVRCGTQDLGTATKTSMAVVAAETLGLDPTDIVSRCGDTNFPPSGGSGGSTTSPSVMPAVKVACDNTIEELRLASGMSDVTGKNWKKACSKIGPDPLVVQGKWREGLSGNGTAGVQMAEVEVDTETGFIKVKKITCVQDCGLLVNLQTAESQANGGIIMGISYALYEERVMDDATGVPLNPNFETYKLPTLADMPEIDVTFQNMPERGVIGIGEPVTVPTAAAIANAVSNAIGIRMTSLPITPAKVLDALNGTPGAEQNIAWDRVASISKTGDFINLDQQELPA
ncbi:Putative xanthine dehydrogenase molybdenum-binding subunit XdhA [Pontiella desulfatans]|uniref:Xanthine dehydrogenase molybdenum-binding subunit XdhA n=1 Tax=Pontiella desulfatans TaxID=2750659 RepID=A0A6C2UBE6_PONDE|nr:xanthine dehydrogenase family protein molybdopterin-binding subunit [Pontiella desulfatans]VGO17365.1 Putative xanthine dehydrogenase molybdenum-binding subunit XdhA [Pontiella desulfatans]